MTAIVVSNTAPFGAMSNTMIENIEAVNESITRLNNAVGAAASGFTGTAGTEYETGSNFGVVPDATPGQQGAAYAYALAELSTAWQTFMSSAQAYITALDNG